ncbi:MAG TPA: aminotransferase class I/II-fold pyridoxal phosphate-dependent enzyme [Desulfobacterales bacterium]|jgi:8-amino-7-oxononanoate synthase|nr:aminotransferase class I/II-fold pyridoxal phosphate-dependent enzyme [Desulfobacterales bacterium]
MANIFSKFQQLAATRQTLAAHGLATVNVVMEKLLSPTEAIVNGRRTILAGTNNYLGLTFDPGCIDAACRALHDSGTGTTGSRAANGTYSGHVALEQELADFFGYRYSIVFSTGYVANLGMIATLVGPGDAVVIDADCHASIYDGCTLSRADIIRFRHNDPDDLDKRLRRLGNRAANTLVIVEGLYSMLGDRAPLSAIAAVKARHGAYLLVDEAHSLGVLGDHGRGLAEETGVADQVDFIVGTFSKSLGAIGGYCVSNHPELDLIRFANRPYVFTASPSPSVIASTRQALAALRTRPELRLRLWENARRLYRGLQDIGLRLGPEVSPIIAIRMNSPEAVVRWWCALLERGVYVNLVLPPATPDGGALLRCSMSAGHTPEQVDQIAETFAALQAAGEIPGPAA